MKRSAVLAVLTAWMLLAALPGFTSQPVVQAQQKFCYWKLISQEPYTSVASTAPTASSSLEGSSVVVNWEGLTILGTWTVPPAQLIPGDELLFEVTSSWSGTPTASATGGIDTQINFNWSGTTLHARRKSINFQAEPSGSISDSLYWTVPAGAKEGAEYTILGILDAAVAGGSTRYIYKYVCEIIPPTVTNTSEATTTTSPTTSPTASPTITLAPTSTPGMSEDFCQISGDSGARFTELWGEVLVMRCQEDYPYYDERTEDMADRDMVLPCGSSITTGGDSGAVLGFSDMSGFTMKACSHVILDTCSRSRSKLSLLAGNILVNLKQMVTKGTLDVTMNQAVAGTKGTIYVAEETGQQSILKVIEGQMWFTSLASGQTVDVFAGQMVSADANGMSPVIDFDVQAELAIWPAVETAESIIPEPVTQQSWVDRNLPAFLNPPHLAIGIIVLLAGLAGFVISGGLLIARITRANAAAAAGSTTSPLAAVVLTLILVSTCLTSLCGASGLYLNLRAPRKEAAVPPMDLTITAMGQTGTAIARELAVSSPTPPAEPSMPETATPQIVETPQPVYTATLEPVYTTTLEPVILPPAPPTIPATQQLPLTGDQRITDHAFVDDFSSEALGWPVKDDGITVQKYFNEYYSFQHMGKDSYAAAFLPISFNPSEILFDVEGPPGNQNGTFGVFCQLQDSTNYYYVEIDMGLRTYVIGQSLQGVTIPLTELTARGHNWQPAPSLHEDPTDYNHISVGCYPGSVALSINGAFVNEVYPETPFTSKGKTTLFVFTYDFAGYEGYTVLFDNVEAYDPVQ